MPVVKEPVSLTSCLSVSLAAVLLTSACGGGSSGSGAPATHSVGGSVTGLTASGLELKNGSSTVTLDAGATSFMFSQALATGTNYSLSVASSPAATSCSIQNGSGTIGNQDVKNIVVSCTPSSPTYALSGSVTGLTMSGLVVSNGADVVPVAPGATSFSMPTALAVGTNYSVSITAQPIAQTCALTNANGTMPAAVVTNVAVRCTHTITESLPYSFGTQASADGTTPTGTLIQGADGNFYGMTNAGGSQGLGTVFKFDPTVTPLNPTGKESVLYSFGSQGASDGANPTHGSLIQASDGNFYAMTKSGGAFSSGAVVRITPGGAETVMHSFGGTGDGAAPDGSLIQASDGNLYGMTGEGGANGTGAVIKISLAGLESVLYSFGTPSSGDGTTPLGSLVQGSDGNLYGMTYSGGNGGFGNGGTIMKVTLAGAETVLHSFIELGNINGATPTGNLIQGTDGNLYGLAYGGPTGAGVVLKVTPAGVVSVLSDFSPCCGVSSGGDLLQAIDGAFYGLGSGGTNGTGTLLKATLAGNLTIVYSFQNSTSKDGANPGDSGLVQGSDGNLYGTTLNGGANGTGAIVKFVISPS
jgi:uncharacterized repeat protein (TIGR03803 family)